MGQIAAIYDVFPQDTETDLDVISNKISSVIPSSVKIINSGIEPVAFGLKKVRVTFLIDDSNESVGEDLENALASIDGVENIECTSTSVV